MKYYVIAELSSRFPVTLLCEIAEIERSAYYKFKKKPLNKDFALEEKIEAIHLKSGKRFGYRSVYAILREEETKVNHKKVQRIMHEKSLFSIVRIKKFIKPKETAIIKTNVLDRNFKANKQGEKYVTDITYLPTRHQIFYLCTIIDLYNNEPVAWRLYNNQNRNLVIDTVNDLAKRRCLEGCIIHSDRGVQYTSNEYVELLRTMNVIQSMSRKGNCWDNAVSESFFSHYKSETIYLLDKEVSGEKQLLEITGEYMEYYIDVRPQRRLGGLSPSHFTKATGLD